MSTSKNEVFRSALMFINMLFKLYYNIQFK